MQTKTIALNFITARYRKIIITALLCINIPVRSEARSVAANFSPTDFGSGNGTKTNNYANSFAVHPNDKLFSGAVLTCYHVLSLKKPAVSFITGLFKLINRISN